MSAVERDDTRLAVRSLPIRLGARRQSHFARIKAGNFKHKLEHQFGAVQWGSNGVERAPATQHRGLPNPFLLSTPRKPLCGSRSMLELPESN